MADKTEIILAISIALLLAGIFLPYLSYYDSYTSTIPVVQTLMTTLFPVIVIIGGGLGVYALFTRNRALYKSL